MEVSGIKMNITNQKKPDAATAFLTKMKASMKVKDLARRLRNGRLVRSRKTLCLGARYPDLLLTSAILVSPALATGPTADIPRFVPFTADR